MTFRETTQNYSNDNGAWVTGAVIPRNGVGRRVDAERERTRRTPLLASEGTSNLILTGLPDEMSRILAPSLKQVVLTKEQFLYQEGDRLDYIYFPDTAVISEFKILEDGRMVEIAVTGREGAVGLTSIFSDSHRAPNCTQVSQAGTAKRVDAVTFERLLRSNENLRNSLGRYVDLYIRQISQKAICNMYHSVKERLCTWLLMLQDRCGRSTLTLTHEQIARTLGVYRPSITCIAQELRTSKLISYSRGGISIRDRRKVEESACTCYAELGAAVAL
jgi:CRP-like cAMP-binding protein